jgi:hypothetical protein
MRVTVQESGARLRRLRPQRKRRQVGETRRTSCRLIVDLPRPSGTAPDAARIVFYSNRSGKHEIRTIRPDGSELTSLTSKLSVRTWYPNWSPDGHAIVAPDGTDKHLPVFGWPPTGVPHQVRPRPQEEPALLSWSWSGDGRKLAGDFNAQRDEDKGLALYTVATKK